MRQLLKLDTRFEWSECCQIQLDIKNAQTNAPILAPFRNDSKVYMYRDAGKTELESVCLQFDDQNKPQICSYMSLATFEGQQK